MLSIYQPIPSNMCEWTVCNAKEVEVYNMFFAHTIPRFLQSVITLDEMFNLKCLIFLRPRVLPALPSDVADFVVYNFSSFFWDGG